MRGNAILLNPGHPLREPLGKKHTCVTTDVSPAGLHKVLWRWWTGRASPASRSLRNTELRYNQVLKVTSSFSVPLGVLSTILVETKCCLRRFTSRLLTVMCLPYSQPEDIGTGGFGTWKEVQWVLLPRCIFAGSEEEISSFAINGFEEKEYCAFVYFLLELSSGYYPVLLSSKTRVTPLTRRSISCQTGVFSTEEALMLRVQIDKTNLWLDTRTAVCCIKWSREWKQFVQNRVNQILSVTETSMWNHSDPGVNNPADVGSHGAASKLKNNKLWWRGPSWQWPSSEQCPESITKECCAVISQGEESTWGCY